MTRISTYFQNQNTLKTLQKANEDLALTSYQVTSGYKAQALSDIAGDATQLLNLRDIQNRTDIYQTNITSATNFVNASQSALQSISDLLEDASSTATLGRNENTAATRASLAPKAQSLAETFYSLLKTQYDGRYVFSGNDGLTSPVSGSATAAAYPGDPLPTTWYQGDSSQSQVITGPNSTLSYGVTGDSDGLVKIKAALEALTYGLEHNSTTDIDSAIATLNSARSDMSGLLGDVGGQLSTLNLISDRYDTQSQFITEQLDSVEKVDVADAMTTFSQQQTILQASMTIITRMNQLSLLDFLK